MARNKLIADRLREVFLNGRWIANTNYKEQLLSLSWKQATQKIATLNTIAALTYHINYYLDGILSVFNGGPLEIKDKFSFDLHEINSEADWKKLTHGFLSNADQFISWVEQMPEWKLDEIFVDEKYSTYLRNIEAMIEHSYYHLGQIVLIKKMILETEL